MVLCKYQIEVGVFVLKITMKKVKIFYFKICNNKLFIKKYKINK